jgi:hypothetical protein
MSQRRKAEMGGHAEKGKACHNKELVSKYGFDSEKEILAWQNHVERSDC